jgi:hypothetical protein
MELVLCAKVHRVGSPGVMALACGSTLLHCNADQRRILYLDRPLPESTHA